MNLASSKKQLEASIYRYQFELADKQDNKVTINIFKEAVIKLKVNLDSIEEKDLQMWLKDHVKEVLFDSDQYEVKFKCLDFS